MPLATHEQLERTARTIAAAARDAAEETERRRALPDSLLDALRASGLMRGGASEDVGAPELPPAETLSCAEEIARGDASAGWCVSIAATSSLLAAYLPEAPRRELFGDRRLHRRRRVGPAGDRATGRRRARGVGPLGVLQRDLALRRSVRRLHAARAAGRRLADRSRSWSPSRPRS